MIIMDPDHIALLDQVDRCFRHLPVDAAISCELSFFDIQKVCATMEKRPQDGVRISQVIVVVFAFRQMKRVPVKAGSFI